MSPIDFLFAALFFCVSVPVALFFVFAIREIKRLAKRICDD